MAERPGSCRGAEGTGASTGFSLLELLVATLCTALLCGAVLTLLVGSAEASRREWAVLAARQTGNAAVAAVAQDLQRAGVGLESADAISVDGTRIPFAASRGDGSVHVVLALGNAREIRGYEVGAGYVVDSPGGLSVGDAVAAIDLPGRPAGAPLPSGTAFHVATTASGTEVRVAWGAAEAAAVGAWGPPRALLPVLMRTYSIRQVDGKLQLDRQNDGGARQPLADGLDEFRVEWILDTDLDGLGDAMRAVAEAAPGVRLCAARVRATMAPPLRRTVGDGRLAPPEQADRWVSFPGC